MHDDNPYGALEGSGIFKYMLTEQGSVRVQIAAGLHLLSEELSTGNVTTKAVLSAEKFLKSGPLGKPPRMTCGSIGASKVERHCVCQWLKQKSGDSFVP